MFSVQIPDNQNAVICMGSVKTGHRHDFNTGCFRVKFGQYIIPYDVGIIRLRNHHGNPVSVIFLNIFLQETAFR